MSDEKIYRVLLSESEIEIARTALNKFREDLPDVHASGHLFLKAFETEQELKIATEVEINNKMQ